jgi:hypothetical protein
MVLHLHFHLAILVVVEGAQRLVQMQYLYYCTHLLFKNTYSACVGAYLDGEALVTNLTDNIEYLKIEDSPYGTLALNYVCEEMYLLSNNTGVC